MGGEEKGGRSFPPVPLDRTMSCVCDGESHVWSCVIGGLDYGLTEGDVLAIFSQ